MIATSETLRKTLVEASMRAVDRLDPQGLVERALPPLPPKRARVRVIAAGKAAIAMTRGALARWPDRIDDALVITTEPAEAPRDPRVTLRFAGHPLPDARSIASAEEALARAGDLGKPDLLLALISGGASALLSLPPAAMPLEEKRAIVSALLLRGTPIADVNAVRRHLSRVKGGRLALAAHPARTMTLIVSDVVRGEPHDVGSGPTVPDETTIADAIAILRRALSREGDEALRARAIAALSESLKQSVEAPRTRASILADPEALARALAAELSAVGLVARAAPAEEGDAAAMAKRRVDLARKLAPGEAVVIPCEPTVALPERHGRGGRAGLVALLAMCDLPSDVALLCAASDGVDGSSGHRGAAVTRELAMKATPEAIREALASFDDARIHAAIGAAIEGGATGNNLSDVHVVARATG